MSKALVIPKDVLNELRRLAVEAERNATLHDEAQKRYLKAGSDDIATSAKLAILLYDFTLKYASNPTLITDKLDELGLQYKKGTSVYYHICRLAFADVDEADTGRMSRYAKVIADAHGKGTTAAEFKKSVSSGITKALARLGAAAGLAPNKVTELGRNAASDYLAKQEYSLGRVDLGDLAKDGDDVQLVARYEGGKLTVYGLIPPSVAQATAALAKLGRGTQPNPQSKFELLPELLKAIKLVTSVSDKDATASYIATDKGVNFIVEAQKGAAIVTASADYDVFGRSLTLPVDTWGRILQTLIPARKKLVELAYDGKSIAASVDDGQIGSITEWYVKSGNPITIGEADGNTLAIEVKSQKSHNELPGGRETTLNGFGERQLETLFKFKLSKSIASLDLSGNTAKVSSSAASIDDRINLTKTTLSHLRAVLKKMLRWNDHIEFAKTKDSLLATVQIGNGMTMRMVLRLVE